jgi:hypothetical protein
MRYALLATGLLALAARATVLTDGGTVSNLTTLAVFIAAAAVYFAVSIID